MTATAQDFSITGGDDADLTVTVTEGGSAKNLAGASARWVLYSLTTGETLIEKTTDAGIAITSAAGGILTVSLNAADTVAMGGAFGHECEVTDSGGNKSTVTKGTATISRGFA